jgi:hypothetical protein
MIKNSEKVVKVKCELLKMAAANESRPSRKSQLGMKLGNYINKTGGSYDPEFAEGIKTIRPEWFNYSSKVAEKKAKLLELAHDLTQQRPKCSLKNSLSSYTVKGGSYDEKFDVIIRTLRPDWFVEGAKKNPPHVVERKNKLLEMARNGEPRPEWEHNRQGIRTRRDPLVMCLYNYTHVTGNSYDFAFDSEIRSLRPDWFPEPKQRKKRRKKRKASIRRKAG